MGFAHIFMHAGGALRLPYKYPDFRNWSFISNTGEQTMKAPAHCRQNGKVPQKKNVNRTLGPISDLERHLPSDWWRTLFNSLYLKTDGDVVENELNTVQDVDNIIQLSAIDVNDKILDLCCGQGRHVLELARRGYSNVCGVDRSRYLIRLARKRAKTLDYSVQFHEGDARKFSPPSAPFHTVLLMGNSFGYFEQLSDDLAILKNINRLLLPQGVVVVDVVDGEWMRDNFEKRSWEWIDENHFVCRERSLAQDCERIISRELISHSEKGVLADQFYAERLYTKEKLYELLESSDFTDIRIHGSIKSLSTREQDMGMMAHRILLTAKVVRKKPPRKKKQAPDYPEVCVLFGDPSLPDKVKVNSQFNAEDFETINRLKKALGELDDYSFSFRDNHQNLISSLRSDPPQFVFNLCDEGYYNDPFKELHVPAILEMLNIPYTGAGPACLGFCYNKNHVRSVADALEIPVPMESYYAFDDMSATIPSTFPALVKPNYGDSSMGITQKAVVNDTVELMDYINWMRGELGPVSALVQEFLSGAEYSVGVIGNPGLKMHVLQPLEVDYSGLNSGLPQILGYESKWLPDSPYWDKVQYKPANLESDSIRKLVDNSILLFERTGCRDYARFDYRADSSGNIKLLEVNPNPGWCWDGKMNVMAGFDGLRYADMLRMIIEAAQERIKTSVLNV